MYRHFNGKAYKENEPRRLSLVGNHHLLELDHLTQFIRHHGVQGLLREVWEVKRLHDEDPDLVALHDALLLAQPALTHDPSQLPAQLMGRITHRSKGLTSLLEECRRSDDVYITASPANLAPAGGPLCSVIADHKHDVMAIVMTQDCRFVVTGDASGRVVVSDLERGVASLAKHVGPGRDACPDLFLCCQDKFLLVNWEGQLEAFRLQSLSPVWQGEPLGRVSVCVAGVENDVILVFSGRDVTTFDARSGSKKKTMKLRSDVYEAVQFSSLAASLPAGGPRHAVCTCSQSGSVTSVDWTTPKILATRLLMKKSSFKAKNQNKSNKEHKNNKEIKANGESIENEVKESSADHEEKMVRDDDENKDNEEQGNGEENNNGKGDLEHGGKDKGKAENAAGISITSNTTSPSPSTNDVGDDDDDDDEALDRVTVVGLALSRDGERDHVVCVTKESHALLLLDAVTLVTLRVLSAPQGFTGLRMAQRRRLRHTACGRYLYHATASGLGVAVWDLKEHSLYTILDTEGVRDVTTPDLEGVVTIRGDPYVRLWDVTRTTKREESGEEAQPSQTGGKCPLSVTDGPRRAGAAETPSYQQTQHSKKPSVKLRNAVNLQSPRYWLLHMERDDLEHLLYVHDAVDGKVVREGIMGKVEGQVHLTHADGAEVAVVDGGRLRLLDVDAMEIVRDFPGKIPPGLLSPPLVLHDSKEVLTLTEDALSLQLHALAEGGPSRVIAQTADPPHPIHTIIMNRTGTICVGETRLEGQPAMLLFPLEGEDAAQRQVVVGAGVLPGEHLGLYPLTHLATLTDDALFLLFSHDCRTVHVYDINSQTIRARIEPSPIEGGNKEQDGNRINENDEEKSSTCADGDADDDDGDDEDDGRPNHMQSLQLMDNVTMVTVHDDHVARVYNLRSGVLLHSLPLPGARPGISVTPDSSVLVLHDASYGQYHVFTVLRKPDLQVLASLTLDTDLEDLDVQLLGNGGDFVLLPQRGARPVRCQLLGRNKKKLLGNHPPHPPLDLMPQSFIGCFLDQEIEDFL